MENEKEFKEFKIRIDKNKPKFSEKSVEKVQLYTPKQRRENALKM